MRDRQKTSGGLAFYQEVVPVIYLDNAATTMVAPEVTDAMRPYFSDAYGNPGSIHLMGRVAEKAVAHAREQVAAPIGAKPDNIIFTSGGSEANTMAIVGLADYLKSIGKTHIITTAVEHHSVLNAMKYLFHSGFNVTYFPVKRDGQIDLDLLLAGICGYTGLVSVMAVNNETGNQYDIYRIGEACRQKGVLFHTDCVQAYCMTDINVDEAHIDFLSTSGHKIHAPKGVGFLYARRKELLRPVIFGGSQEYSLRGGTENVPGIVGMGQAAELAQSTHSYAEMAGELTQRVMAELPGVHVNGLPHSNSKIINLRFDGVDGETLLMLLDSKGVVVSAGSACSAHYATPSHVLTAMRLTEEEARSSIRISISRYTTSEEIDKAASIIIDSVKQLRGG